MSYNRYLFDFSELLIIFRAGAGIVAFQTYDLTELIKSGTDIGSYVGFTIIYQPRDYTSYVMVDLNSPSAGLSKWQIQVCNSAYTVRVYGR